MHWHKYGNWSEVKREESQFVVGLLYQTRDCKACGKVQRRYL